MSNTPADSRRIGVTVTIHYASPAGDPFKIPRPHRVDIDEYGMPSQAYGGEIGPVGNLLGFCPTPTPELENWTIVLADKLYDGDVTAESLVGWHPQFSGDGNIFGYSAAIEYIEVS